MITIALRNIFRNKGRTAAMLALIAFGCIATIFVRGYFEDTYFKMRESYIHAHTGHLQIYKKGFSRDRRRNPGSFLIEDPQTIVTDLERLDGVFFAAPRLYAAATVTAGNQSVSCHIQGVDATKERVVPVATAVTFRRHTPLNLYGAVLEEGRLLAGGSMTGALLGKGLAGALRVKPGDPITIMAGTVNGSLNAWDLTVEGIIFTSLKVFDDHTMRVALPLAQELLRTQSAHALVVMLDDTSDTDHMRDQLEQLFTAKNWDLEIKTWYELNDFYRKTKNLFDALFFILNAILAAVITLSVYNTMHLTVLERTNEIGTLMALGNRKSVVVRLFLTEGILLGICGGTIGTVIGVALTATIGSIGITMPPPPGATMSWTSEPAVTFGAVAIAFGSALATAFVSAILPAVSASRLSIADALRTSN